MQKSPFLRREVLAPFWLRSSLSWCWSSRLRGIDHLLLSRQKRRSAVFGAIRARLHTARGQESRAPGRHAPATFSTRQPPAGRFSVSHPLSEISRLLQDRLERTSRTRGDGRRTRPVAGLGPSQPVELFARLEGIMLRELIPRVARARSDLKVLHARLEKINELSSRRDQLDFEDAGRDAQTIRDLQESIERDIRAPKLPGSAKTGTGIGAAPAAGPAIGRSPKTGTEIGQEGVTGHDIGATPRNSRDIGGSGLSGFEIGATGRAGPAIGESTLNQETSSSVNSTLQRSTVGSSISDSSVGSNMNSSTVGSSMQDTSVGSSLGGSSVGSSLPSR